MSQDQYTSSHTGKGANRSPAPLLDRISRVTLAIAAVILFYQLLLPPVVGVTDNGDWGRIMGPAGFEHLGKTKEETHQFFTLKVRFAEPWWESRYLCTGRWIAQLARPAGRLLFKDGLFDLRLIGTVHALLLLAGLGMLLAAARHLPAATRIALSLLLVLVFTDVHYAAYFNTFYAQPASLCFLLLAAGFLALLLSRGQYHAPLYLGFVISAALFSVSKPQEAPQSILLGALAVLAARLPGGHRRLRSSLAIAILTVFFAAYCAFFASPVLKHAGLYNAFFHEMLAHSPDPAADLSSLGLDPQLARLAGTYAAQGPVNEPWFEAAFFERMSYGRLLLFYLGRPSQLWALIKRRAEFAFENNSGYGHFTRESGYPLNAQSSAFRLWSGIKRRILPGSVWMMAALFGGQLLAAAILFRRGPREPRFRLGLAAYAALSLMAIGAFLIVTFGDFAPDQVRQSYSFKAMTDLGLIVSTIGLFEIARRALVRRRLKAAGG